MGSKQQFRLKWNSYGNNLAAAFGKLYESEILADISIFCEGDIYKAHKVVLAACSKHFQDLFERSPSAQNLVLILDGTTSVNLRALLQFMYHGEVYVEESNLSSFLRIAETLQVRGLSVSDSSFHDLTVPEDGYIEKDKCPPLTPLNKDLSPTILAKKPPPRAEGYESDPYPSQSPHSRPPPPTSAYPSTSNSSGISYLSQYHMGNSARDGHFLASGLMDGRVGSDGRRKRQHLIPSMSHIHSSVSAIEEDKINREKHQKEQREREQQREQREREQQRESIDSELMHRLTASSSGSFHINPGGGGQGGGGAVEDSAGLPNKTEIIVDDSSHMPRNREGTMPEDLRIKMEPRDGEVLPSHRFPPSPLSPPRHSSTPMEASNSPSWHTPFAQQHPSTVPDSIGGSNISSADNTPITVQGPEGKKLKCPFCDRLYGYETNLRAHIRQRHQGIRVPCPFCTRTFTRNNTVRRHIAREHRALIGTQLENNNNCGPTARGLQQRGISSPPHMVNSTRPPTSSPAAFLPPTGTTTAVSAITHTSQTSYGATVSGSGDVSTYHHPSDRQGFNPPPP